MDLLWEPPTAVKHHYGLRVVLLDLVCSTKSKYGRAKAGLSQVCRDPSPPSRRFIRARKGVEGDLSALLYAYYFRPHVPPMPSTPIHRFRW